MALAVRRSLMPLKPLMSEKNNVAGRRSDNEVLSLCTSISLETMRGSIYLPNVSLTRSFSFNWPTMLLKASLSLPISSREVTGNTTSRLPVSTSLVPASSSASERCRRCVSNKKNPRPATVAKANRMPISMRMPDCCFLVSITDDSVRPSIALRKLSNSVLKTVSY